MLVRRALSVSQGHKILDEMYGNASHDAVRLRVLVMPDEASAEAVLPKKIPHSLNEQRSVVNALLLHERVAMIEDDITESAGAKRCRAVGIDISKAEHGTVVSWVRDTVTLAIVALGWDTSRRLCRVIGSHVTDSAEAPLVRVALASHHAVTGALEVDDTELSTELTPADLDDDDFVTLLRAACASNSMFVECMNSIA